MKHMRFALLLAASLLLAPMAARAQSSPGLVAKQVPSALQWNSFFSAKQDYSSQLSAFSTLSGSGLLFETAGTPGLASLSSLLDLYVGSTTGTLVVRTGGGWAALASAAGCLQSTGTGVLPAYGSCSGTVGAGTVTSVALALPGSVFTVSGSPVTASGTLTGAFATQTANKVFAGPTTGSAATPAMRLLVGADLPNPSSSTLGGVQSLTATTNNFVTGISTSGVPSVARPTCGNLSDATACATAIGTSGATLPLNNTNNVFSGVFAMTGAVKVPGRLITASGTITVSATTDHLVCVKKTTGAATSVSLPSSPPTWLSIIVKDCKGDAATNNITVSPASGTIDGAATFVMNVAYQAQGFVFNGTEWSLD
jgi:hypothetical protein